MTGPAPAVAAVRTAVRHALADLPADALVLVGCSGGADSLALAAATAFVAPRAGLRAGAVVVDHGLQPGSADVAARAATVCRGLGLGPVEVVAVSVAGPGGPEAAARAARHRALADVAARHGAAAVLLGHTLDDQAETVLLRLARGSGARSLAGMPAVRGPLRRPLLGLRRVDTEAACAALGLAPWTDPTNGPAEPGVLAPLRSRVRHEVLPVLEEVLGPGVVPALARSAAALAADDAALTAAAADLLARARVGGGVNGVRPAEDGGRGDAVERAECQGRAESQGRAKDGGGAGGVGHAEDGGRGDAVGRAECQGRAEDGGGAGGVGQAKDGGRDEGAGRPGVGHGADAAVLAGAPAAVRRRAVRELLTEAGVPGGDLRSTHVLAVDALLTDWRGQGPVALPGGRSARRHCGRLSVDAGGP